MVIGDILVLALVFGAVVAIVVGVSRIRTPPWTNAEWVAEHITAGDRTVVVVARKLSNRDRSRSEIAERREIGGVANADPDYERKLLDLLETATNRAALLNSTPNG
jgi:hypothetical protein